MASTSFLFSASTLRQIRRRCHTRPMVRNLFRKSFGNIPMDFPCLSSNNRRLLGTRGVQASPRGHRDGFREKSWTPIHGVVISRAWLQEAEPGWP